MRNNILGQDSKTGDLYFKENSFSLNNPSSSMSPPPPVSTLYKGAYGGPALKQEHRPPSGISVHLRTPEPSEVAKLERHLQSPDITRNMSPSPSLLEPPPLFSEPTYVEPSDPRGASPAPSKGSNSPSLQRSHSPFEKSESPLPPVGDNLYNSDYIRTPTPKSVSPYLASQPKPKSWPKH